MNHMNDQMGMHDISIISIDNSILGGENFQQKGHSVHNNTDHFLWFRLEKLAIMGQKLISYHIESST